MGDENQPDFGVAFGVGRGVGVEVGSTMPFSYSFTPDLSMAGRTCLEYAEAKFGDDSGAMSELQKRPRGISALSIFFLAGALISFTASASLLFPGSFSETMWRVNPRAHKQLSEFGRWGSVLLFAVSISCAMAAIGLWRRAAWGHKFAVGLIAINLIGDVANTLTGTEPRAIVGVPIALAILIYLLSKRVRDSFG